MRRRYVALAGLAIALAGFAGSHQLMARAANLPATCATLQVELNLANTGDTVTLTNAGTPCTAPTITYPITLPNKEITLTGAAAGDGFDGGGTAQLLTGTDVGGTVISNLTFQNGHTTGHGGAILIDGTAHPTISNCTFLGNLSTGTGAVDLVGSGGTITLTGNTFGGTASGAGNASSGAFPGAVWIDSHTDVTVTHNSFIDNTSDGTNNGDGGAGAIFVVSRSSGANIIFTNNTVSGNSETSGGGIGGGATLQGLNVTVTANSFIGNSIGSGNSGGPGSFGGGLDIVASGPTGALTQSHNLFQDNHIGAYEDTSARGTEVYFGGGGEFAQTPSITSFDDTFIGNTVDGGFGNTTGAGGGLGVQGDPGGSNKTTLTASNLVATNNTVKVSEDGEGNGGGVYAGFVAGCAVALCPAEIDLFDSTITANSADSGPGMSGGVVTDVGKVTNSIVYGNTGNAAQLNFGSLTVTSSDSCSAANTAYTGTGNVCVNPSLVNPAGNDVHETAASPTINAGNNALIPSGVGTDYAGQARIIGGTVDMGAAEFSPVIPTTPPVPASGAVAESAVPAGLGLITLGALLLAVLGVSVAVARSRRRSTPPA
jgi:hypothetical protein